MGSEPLRILDVGGGQAIILKFLPEDQVTVLDQSEPEEEVSDFVKGDATALPFEDEAFDYAISVDTYEHIPPEARDTYLSELRRTARKGVLLAAPFDSAMARDAERTVNEFNRAVHLMDNVWLQEHAENGLPRLDDARRFFERHEDTVSVLPNGYVPHWLAMMCLTFYKPKLGGELGDLADRINTFYNEFVYELDNAEPCYRYLLVSLKQPAGVDLDELAASGRSVEGVSERSALFGTLSAVLPLSAEAARSKAALARKEAQVNDLSRRLAQQVSAGDSRLARVERRVAGEERRAAELQRGREEMRRQRDQAQQQLDRIAASRAWRLLTALHKLRLVAVRRLRGSG